METEKEVHINCTITALKSIFPVISFYGTISDTGITFYPVNKTLLSKKRNIPN